MIIGVLLYLHGTVTDWIWSVLPRLPEAVLHATYDLVGYASTIIAQSGWLDFYPVELSFFWIQFIFWAWFAALIVAVLRKIAILAMGARGEAV